MTTPVFTWTISYTTTVDEEPRRNVATYGDGYTQRAQDGLNPILPKWNVVMTDRPTSDAADIRDFLKTQGGVTAFQWTDPDGHTGKFICAKWNRAFNDYGGVTITAVFEEVPE